MTDHNRTATRSGALLLVQLAGLIAPFVLLLPMLANGSFLDQAPPVATQVRLAVLWLTVNGVVTIGLALTVYPAIRTRTEALAKGLVLASIAVLVLQVVDNMHLLSMLSLGEAAQRPGTNRMAMDTVAQLLTTTRRWSHMNTLLAIDSWVFLFYLTHLRAGMLPRLLAFAGITTVVLHAIGVPLPPLVGRPSIPPLAYWMAVTHLATAGWLIMSGRKRPQSLVAT